MIFYSNLFNRVDRNDSNILKARILFESGLLISKMFVYFYIPAACANQS